MRFSCVPDGINLQLLLAIMFGLMSFHVESLCKVPLLPFIEGDSSERKAWLVKQDAAFESFGERIILMLLPTDYCSGPGNESRWKSPSV